MQITVEEETGYIAEFFYFVFFMTLIHFVFNCIFKIALTVQESKTLKGCLVVLGWMSMIYTEWTGRPGSWKAYNPGLLKLICFVFVCYLPICTA